PRSTSRWLASTSGVIVSSSRRSRSRRFTISYTLRNGLWNPRFGTRLCSGIWPPSNHGCVLPPVRALWPLCPRPLVLPRPDPGPRPTRLRSRCAPSGRLRSLSFAMLTLASPQLFHSDQVPDLEDHAADRRVVVVHHRLLVPPQAQGPEGGPVLGRPADSAPHLRDLQP